MTPKHSAVFLFLIVLALLSIAHAQTSILGFTPSHSTREIEIESKFKSIPLS